MKKKYFVLYFTIYKLSIEEIYTCTLRNLDDVNCNPGILMLVYKIIMYNVTNITTIRIKNKERHIFKDSNETSNDKCNSGY